jgi:hypothetical protein
MLANGRWDLIRRLKAKFWYPSTTLHRVTSQKSKHKSTGVVETLHIPHALLLHYTLTLNLLTTTIVATPNNANK